MSGYGNSACWYGDYVYAVGNVTVVMACWCVFDMGSSVVMVVLCGCCWGSSRVMVCDLVVVVVG